jgi:hypothetical protein
MSQRTRQMHLLLRGRGRRPTPKPHQYPKCSGRVPVRSCRGKSSLKCCQIRCVNTEFIDCIPGDYNEPEKNTRPSNAGDRSANDESIHGRRRAAERRRDFKQDDAPDEEGLQIKYGVQGSPMVERPGRFQFCLPRNASNPNYPGRMAHTEPRGKAVPIHVSCSTLPNCSMMAEWMSAAMVPSRP